MKKTIYVAHPFRGDHHGDAVRIGDNVAKVSRICERIAEVEKDALILSPIHAFSFMSPIGDQTRVMKMCLELLALADELWVFGDWRKSEGCRQEMKFAKEAGIPFYLKGEENWQMLSE